MKLTEELLSDRGAIRHLPYSKCRNCNEDVRLYKGKWHHIGMAGGDYREWDSTCNSPLPLRCRECGGRIDYRMQDATDYDFSCLNCIDKQKQGDKIGRLTKEFKKQLQSGKHPYLKYGAGVSAVITKTGIYFVDIW